MDTQSRLHALYDDVSAMDSKSPVEWAVGAIFNALLEQAKADHPDDPGVKAVEPVKESGSGQFIAGCHAGALRAMVGQLKSAYDESAI